MRLLTRHPSTARTEPLPDWLLLPGLILLTVAAACYLQYQQFFPSRPLDLEVYRGGVDAFRDGAAVYRQGYGPIGLLFTYPPAALVVLFPLGLAGLHTTHVVLTVAGFAAIFLVVWLVTGMLGLRGAAGRIGLAAGLTGLALWLEPVQTNAGFGQINALLMAVIVLDLALLRHTRFAGAGIGLAVAIKLVPGIFVVYLILTRRFRTAATAVGTFVVVSVIGVAVVPHSAEFWLRGLFVAGDRVTSGNPPQFSANQSLRGLLARFFEETPDNRTIIMIGWLVLAVAVAAFGMFLAARAAGRGEEAAAMCLVALTGLLVSPVSWTHHWVWIAPFLLVAAELAFRQRGTLQTLAVAVPPLIATAFLVWPSRVRFNAPIQANGITWLSYQYPPMVQKVGESTYVLAGLVLFVLAALWLMRPGARAEQEL